MGFTSATKMIFFSIVTLTILAMALLADQIGILPIVHDAGRVSAKHLARPASLSEWNAVDGDKAIASVQAQTADNLIKVAVPTCDQKTRRLNGKICA